MTEPNVPNNNLAGRLYEILAKAWEVRKKDKVSDVFAEALEINSNNPGEVFQGLANLYNLVKDTRLAIERLQDINYELYLRPIQDIEQALGRSDFSSSDWRTFKQSLDPSTFALLEVCADTLSRKAAEIAIDKEQLSELQNEVRQLLEKTVESDLTDEIKSFIFEKLQSIDQAIINYRYYGSAALQRTVEASIGAALRYKEQLQEKPENPVLARFFEIISKADLLVRLGVNTKQLLPEVFQGVRRLLGSSNSGE